MTAISRSSIPPVSLVGSRTIFIPYDTEIVFDGDQRFRQTYDSVSERGNWKIWQSHMQKLRKSGRLEIKFMMAASFASVLVSLLGGLPFIVDLWGEKQKAVKQYLLWLLHQSGQILMNQRISETLRQQKWHWKQRQIC